MTPRGLGRHVIAWVVAGGAGSIMFWLFQVLTGGATITAFMGDQIVSAGGYPTPMAVPLGWAVHLGVSLSYALLFAVVAAAAERASPAVAASVTLLAALVLGWITAVIAPPAISVTIGILSGHGWPSEMLPLNFELGSPLWNHLIFFLLNWIIQVLGPRVFSQPAAARQP